MEKKKIKTVAETFHLSSSTARKYINMSVEEITGMDMPKNYEKRESTMNAWLNIIYKMMADNHSNETIYFYVTRQVGFNESKEKLCKYIYLLGKNNFPNRPGFRLQYMMDEEQMPDNVICIKRNELLKYVLTCNPKTKKDKTIESYIEQIKDKYPVIGRIEKIFHEFHTTLMGNNPEKLDVFLETYGKSEIEAFCNGIKRDIAPVKNAISHPESSGFVEGNNNKFKLLKRIVYGRSELVNLEKKCKLAFMQKTENFSLQSLV